MFSFGFTELVVLFVVLLLVVGPNRLPGVVRTIGYWVGRGRRMMSDVQRELEQEANRMDAVKKTVEDPMKEFKAAIADIGSQTKAVMDEAQQTSPQTSPQTPPTESANSETNTAATAIPKSVLAEADDEAMQQLEKSAPAAKSS